MKKNAVFVSDEKPVSSEQAWSFNEPRKPRRHGRVATLLSGLLLILPLAIAATERLRTRVANEIQHCSPRVGWYFQSGQWLADVRTFAAACEFVLERDADSPAMGSTPGHQLATPNGDQLVPSKCAG